MTYIGEDGKRHQPFMVHRALLGSIERFFGILVEQYAGAFPMWLAPVQAKILPVTNRAEEYAKEIQKTLRAQGLRVDIDFRSESLGSKIKLARNERVPYMLIVGDKEVDEKSISVRSRREGELGSMNINDLSAKMLDEVENKTV